MFLQYLFSPFIAVMQFNIFRSQEASLHDLDFPLIFENKLSEASWPANILVKVQIENIYFLLLLLI